MISRENNWSGTRMFMEWNTAMIVKDCNEMGKEEDGQETLE